MVLSTTNLTALLAVLLVQNFASTEEAKCDARSRSMEASNKAVMLREVPADFLVRFPSGEQTQSSQRIHDVMQSIQPKLDALYDRMLEQTPHFNDKITVAIALQPDGSIAGLEVVARTTAADAFEKSVLDLIRPLSFGPGCGLGYYDMVRTLAFVSPRDELPWQPVSVSAGAPQANSEWDKVARLNKTAWIHWLWGVSTLSVLAIAAALTRWLLAVARVKRSRSDA